ncbi:MAG: hypothetical protein IJN54_13915 [Lachnospiraceae bacterium]|nr:hypothetical protein [Lachnospiraceae bacterium]
MLKFEQKLVDIIHKIQGALERGELEISQFPIEDIINLIESALGENVWRSIGSRPEPAFSLIGQEYRKMLSRCMENRDVEQCIGVLSLLEYQYRCFYTALGRDEQLYREETLRKLVLRMGDAYAEVQCRKLNLRQEDWKGEQSLLESGKGVVYTCLVKDEARLPLPEYRNVAWDYICFTNRQDLAGKTAGMWEFRLIREEEQQHKAETFYKYKVKPWEVLPEYDYSIWIDPQVQIVGPLEQWYKIYGRNASFLGFPAYDKDDIYTSVSTTMTEDDRNIELRWKLLQYRKEGFPEHYGLINTNLMLRSHRDETLNQVMRDWWKEMHECNALLEYAFSYAAWKNELKYALCGLFAENNAYIKNEDIDLETDIHK